MLQCVTTREAPSRTALHVIARVRERPRRLNCEPVHALHSPEHREHISLPGGQRLPQLRTDDPDRCFHTQPTVMFHKRHAELGGFEKKFTSRHSSKTSRSERSASAPGTTFTTFTT